MYRTTDATFLAFSSVRGLLVAVMVFLAAGLLPAQQAAVQVREVQLTLPTYDEGQPNPNPQFFSSSCASSPTIRTPYGPLRTKYVT